MINRYSLKVDGFQIYSEIDNADGEWCRAGDVAELEKELAKAVAEAERLREENEKLKAELNKAYDACAQAAEDMYGLEG